MRRRNKSKFDSEWTSNDIPLKQWRTVETQIQSFSEGNVVPEFNTLKSLLDSCTVSTAGNLLEVGAASGYYSQVIGRSHPHLSYVGVDYSQALVEFGRQRFPGIELVTADATSLPFGDLQFDIVISGSVLLHVYDWKLALAESARVTNGYLILHRTPVSAAPTALFQKRAYGHPMIEWSFEESELVEVTRTQGLVLDRFVGVYGEEDLRDKATRPVQRSYLFRRE